MADGFDASGAITAAAQKYGVDPDLAIAIAHAESGLNPAVPDSPLGAIGTMQLMPATAQTLGVDPRDPAQNVEGGVRYIRQLSDQFNGDPTLIAAAYNAGPHAVVAHGGVPPYRETREYVQKVTANADPTANMPPPDAVLKGYSAAPDARGSPPAAQSSPADVAAAGSDAMPDPQDVLGGYKSQKPGTGAFTSGPDRKPVNAAQEATLQRLAAQGKLNASAPVGSDAFPWPERPDIPTPPGVAHIDAYGNFVPAATAKPEAPAPAPEVPAGQGNPASNFVGDWAARAAEGNAAIHQGMDAITHPTASDQVFRAMGLPTLNDVKTTGGVLGVASAPFMSAFDQVVGRPVGALANAANAITGVAPGYEADPRRISDVASVVAPLGDAALANRAIAAGAKAAGMTESAYVAAKAADAAAAPVTARLAIPPKSVVSTNPVVNAITSKAAPYVAGLSKGSAEKQAGQFLVSKATNPGAVRSVLGESPTEIVPESRGTTFQIAGDLGLGSLERGYAARFPDQAAAVAADQNKARVAALQGIQSGGDPMAVAKALQEQFGALDAEHETNVANATQAARAATDAAGGTLNPEDYGARLREGLNAAADTSKANYGGLYRAIDPEGTMTLDASPVAQGAAKITADIPSTAAELPAAESAIYDTAAKLGPGASMRDVMAFRVRVGQAATQARAAGDNIQAARLNTLKASIDDALAGRVSEQVASDAKAVAAGQLAPENTVLARWQAEAQRIVQQRTAQARAGTATGTGDLVAGRAGAVPGGNGNQISTTGGPADAAGSAGVPQTGGPSPGTGAKGLTDANAAFAAHQDTFGLGNVGKVLNRDAHNNFVLPNGQVPEAIFKRGPSGYESVTAALKADPTALPVLEDYAAMSLRRVADPNATGVIDSTGLARWKKANGDALRALPPETQARFADAATAGDAIAEAQAARNAAIRTAQQGAAAKLLGVTDPSEVTGVVGSILQSKTGAVTGMGNLAAKVAGDPEAVTGLRQAVMDHILNAYVANREAATTGVSALKNDNLQTFVRQNRAALAKVFSPAELDTLDAIGADIRQSRRSQDAIKLPGSNTVQDKYSAEATPGGKKGAHAPILQILGAALGGSAGAGHGAAAGGEGGVLGMMAGNYLDAILQGLKAKGITRVDDLVREAVFNPEVARRLLAKVPTNGAGETAPKILRARLNALIAALGTTGATTSQAVQPPPERHYSAFTPSAKTPVAITAPNAITR